MAVSTASIRLYSKSLSSPPPANNISRDMPRHRVIGVWSSPLQLLCQNSFRPTNIRGFINLGEHRMIFLRSTSSSSGEKTTTSNNNSKVNESTGSEGGGSDDPSSSTEIVLTPGEKVVATTRLFFWAGAFTFASMCAYYIGKELIPTKMSPNTVFDKATSIVRQNEEVKRRFGDSFKTYGRDHGGHREGRRNFIEHTEYTDPDDGSQRTRVRFNLEGAYGSAFVFAEVSKDMPSGEFVYILVQDKRNGAVITVQDNRSALLAKRLAGGSQEGQDVFSRLLGGGSGGAGKQ
ncbi:hypothetical protein ACHAWU_008181 [Discostella pseudostelligera]|uniref:Mitochondrial import inner membrane translocase subunit Tim21 n=1 Tax=Discostella pseudostelligera TaxID=259834 RepID=A0ABD3MFA6_9STRA